MRKSPENNPNKPDGLRGKKKPSKNKKHIRDMNLRKRGNSFKNLPWRR